VNQLDTILREAEQEGDDDTCVQLDNIPGTRNWWCPTAPEARALAEQHAASLGPGWTVDPDARPRPHYHVVQVARDPVNGRERWRRLRDGGHYLYGGRRPYRRRPGRELETPELAASGRWVRAGDVIVVLGADGDQALARELRAAPAGEVERELRFSLRRIPYGKGPLSRLAQQLRLDLGLRRGGNVAVFELENLPERFRQMALRHGGPGIRIDGNRFAVQNVRGATHSEQLGHELIVLGRKAGLTLNVRRIYTEYNPCIRTCLPLIQRNYPSAEVTYSFVWERWGRETPDRNAAVDALFKGR
jgi:hypothetical protein